MAAISFDHTTTGYRLPHARCLAHAAQLAYKDEATVEATAHEWGFDRVRSFHVPFQSPFPLQDTPASDGMIVTVFRGTQPTEIRD